MMVESSSSERAHRSSSTTSELFICFSTSRLSSSSMKLSSKSLLSPGRSSARDSQQISLSRRLRTSGSIKGGASPMFPSSSSGSKKRAGYENPEPSSPKVTCIGQVRVKTKKQGKKMRLMSSRSKRSRSCSGSAAEASFRRAEQSINSNESFHALHFPTHHHQMSSSSQRECMQQRNNNQKWVHLPLTICEALKAFGSEFNCLVPNKSSCGGGGDEAKKEEERRQQQGGRSESSSCGAVFARWFVALGDGEDGNKRRDIELVVGEEEEDEVRTEISSSGGGRSLRRQVFEGIEFKEEMSSDALMREEEQGRVSICVPPKNALLLMRCRSDPVKMAALGNRFWEMPGKDEDEEDGYEAHQQHKDKEQSQYHFFGIETEPAKVIEDEMMCEKWVCNRDEDEKQEEASPVSDMDEADKSRSLCEVLEATEEQQCQEDKEEVDLEQSRLNVNEEELEFSLADIFADPEMAEQVLVAEEAHEEEEEEEEEVEMTQVQLQISDPKEEEAESWTEAEAEQSTTVEAEQSTTECTTWEEEAEQESPLTVNEPEPEPVSVPEHEPKRSSQSQSPVLPDCLLLMMCEPKLSMEVSKETWVCSTDFIRCLPERHVSRNNKKKDGKDEAKKPPRKSIDSKAAAANLAQAPMMMMMQPPRSSCSFPIQAGGGPLSMAEIIGQKLVGSAGGGGGYEPFVLTRCKSEPMRTASKLAAPEACFWKNRKMEPHHRPGPLGGVGATGVGF